MSKRNIGYVIKLLPGGIYDYAYSNILQRAAVFPTREKAREDKCRYGGSNKETIWRVALDCSGRPVSIIKKMR